jgi:hypothetical protein
MRHWCSQRLCRDKWTRLLAVCGNSSERSHQRFSYQVNGRPMRFPQLTPQILTIEGTWQGDERQLRFTGTISSSAPFVILSLLRCGDAFHYTKHNKSDALEVPLNLYQGKFPHQNRYQHTLMIGNSVNTDAVSEGRLLPIICR